MIEIIWPESIESRMITEIQIKIWASNAIEDGELNEDDVDLSNLESCAKALDTLGFFTLVAGQFDKE